MKKLMFGSFCLFVAELFQPSAFANDKALAAWWKFDEGKGKVAVDSISQIEDSIRGNFKYVKGVSGTALKFDGFTTNIVRKASEAPDLSDTFTIEARVALGAYPWN